MEDYSKEVKKLISKYEKNDIVFGKDWKFFYNRIYISEEEAKREVMSCNNLSFVQKQIKNGEIRYALFFKYSNRKARKYVITFREKELRIITIYSLGRNTMRRYRKKGLNI